MDFLIVTVSKMNLPSEEELNRRREELRIKEARLVEKELELSTVMGELLHFQGLYSETVGRLYVELDELRAKNARRFAEGHPNDTEAELKARKAAGEAKSSRSEYEATDAEARPFLDRPEPTPDLKETYRRLAKLHHPDLSNSNEDRSARNAMMARINEAYRAGDLDALLRIERESEPSSDRVKREGAAAELRSTIRKIHQVDSRLEEIDVQIAELKKGYYWRLYIQWQTLRDQGVDLLDKLCQEIRGQIATEESRGAS